ncbi:MAG TPA: DoxX family protein [Afifellaceae bacterium]|nr:DoxX family protein [Afifellaceae bacterium]
MTQLQNSTILAGRILLAAIFVIAGFQKIGGFAGTQQYMETFGIPGMLLPLVILLELGGGLMIVAGLLTRWTALALAGFTLVAGIVFHADFGDQMQSIMFMKNLAITGGLLVLATFGPGALSLDARREPIAAVA